VAQPSQRLEPDANDEDGEEHEAFAPEHEAPSDRELNGNEHGERRPSGAGDDAVSLAAAPDVHQVPGASRDGGHQIEPEPGSRLRLGAAAMAIATATRNSGTPDDPRVRSGGSQLITILEAALTSHTASHDGVEAQGLSI
jgi:hypothetical protein